MSTLKINTLQAVAGGATVPIADVINGTARAWVTLNGVGTVAILASYNVASITDNGVGDWTANFTTALADTKYVPAGSAEGETGTISNRLVSIKNGTRLAGSINLYVSDGSGAKVDVPSISVAFFR